MARSGPSPFLKQMSPPNFEEHRLVFPTLVLYINEHSLCYLWSLAILCIMVEIHDSVHGETDHASSPSTTFHCAGKHRLFLHSTVGGHLGIIWPGVIAKKAALHILLHAPWCTCALGAIWNMTRKGYAGQSVFGFRKYSQTVPQSGCTGYICTSRV